MVFFLWDHREQSWGERSLLRIFWKIRCRISIKKKKKKKKKKKHEKVPKKQRVKKKKKKKQQFRPSLPAPRMPASSVSSLSSLGMDSGDERSGFINNVSASPETVAAAVARAESLPG
jgi:hypothetical protein